MPTFVIAWDLRTGREYRVTPAALAQDPHLTDVRPEPTPSKPPRRPARETQAASGATTAETPVAGEKE